MRFDKDFPLPRSVQKYFNWEVRFTAQATIILIVALVMIGMIIGIIL